MPEETTKTNNNDRENAHYLRSGLIMAIAGTALFAMKSIFIKMAYLEGVDTVTLMTQRLVVAFPVYLLMLLWLLFREHKPVPKANEWLTVAALGFIGYYLASWLDMEGLNHISAQLERLTLYTYPIMTTLLSWLFLREIITRRVLIALTLTYSGVMLLYTRESLSSDANTTYGVLMVAAAALSFSCYVVFSKPWIMRLGSRLFTSIAMLASTGYVLIHYAALYELNTLFSHPTAWKYGVLLAIFSTVLPSFMVSEAIARLGASRTSIIGTVGPVFTILMAVVILGEPFGWYHLTGMVLVMGGVSLLRK